MMYACPFGRVLPWLPAALIALLAGCHPADAGPEITHVQPAAVEPGGFVLISGRNFRSGDTVAVAGRPVASLTRINEELLTVTLPAPFSEGAHPVEVRSLDGQWAAWTLNVRGSAPVPASPPAVDVPSALPSPHPPWVFAPSPRPQAEPPRVALPASKPAEQDDADERLREQRKEEAEYRREQQKEEAERLREHQKHDKENRRDEDRKRGKPKRD